MRPELVGLVEVGDRDQDRNRGRVGDRVVKVTLVEETEPFIRTTSRSPEAPDRGVFYDHDVRHHHEAHRRRPDILSVFRSTMVPWRADKPKTPRAVVFEYIPKAKDAAADSDGENSDSENSDGRWVARHKPRLLTWHTYLLGLALVSLILLVVDVSETIAARLLIDRNAKGDPFGNWGKPGTGTELLSWYPTDFLRDVIPIPCHSHNDYWRKVPLFSAIYAGCTGVEADVWLRDGDLLVGHDTASLQPNRTFQSLYVNPLVEILTHQNPSTEFYKGTTNGVFDVDPDQTLVLLVDLKTEGPGTWPWVTKQLEPLREKGWLSYAKDGEFHQRPITVVGTGNTPFDLIVGNSTYRDAFFDAPLDKLENSPYNSTNSYYASVNFWSAIGAVWWRGGPSDDQMALIRKQLREARDRGLKSRYWGSPSWPIHVRNLVWEALVGEDVGMLNVDDLDAATKEDWRKPGTF